MGGCWWRWPMPKPSDSIREGKCPSCAGEGKVYRVVSDSIAECSTCGGAGVWPPPYSDVIDQHHGAVAIIFGDEMAHHATCVRVKSQRRLMSERRAARGDKPGPLFQSREALEKFFEDRDPCDCGGVPIDVRWPRP